MLYVVMRDGVRDTVFNRPRGARPGARAKRKEMNGKGLGDD